jgi:hypothetical protein
VKQTEKKYRKYVIVMILCFLFGGFSLILYLLQLYSVIWQADLISAIRMEGGNLTVPVFSRELRYNTSFPNRRPMPLENPFSLLYSSFSIVLLSMGIISLLSGFSIWNLIREKELKSTKKTLLDTLLLPDEKIIMDMISENEESLTQRDIVRNTNFSRVKVHRILKNLERKNLIIKQPYGMTNKIVLKK